MFLFSLPLTQLVPFPVQPWKCVNFITNSIFLIYVDRITIATDNDKYLQSNHRKNLNYVYILHHAYYIHIYVHSYTPPP